MVFTATKEYQAVILEPYRWSTEDRLGVRLHSVGRSASVDKIAEILSVEKPPDLPLLADRLLKAAGCFSLIAETDRWIFCATDKVRGYPVFYSEPDVGFMVSNSARALATRSGLREPDEEALLVFGMSGYVTGSETVIRGILQLRAGEMLLWDKAASKLELVRYYKFFPDDIPEKNETQWIDELQKKTDEIFDRLVEEADGRPIWVPLSGGLDSRLIACQLARRKYKELNTFSYGLPGNHEAKIAQKVAQKIGVSWSFVPTRRGDFRRFFRSTERKKYWEFCDQLCSLPNMQDITPIKDLVLSGKIGPDHIIVNGQSGDFVSGMHLPAELEGREDSWELFQKAVFHKHLSQWPKRLTENNINILVSRLIKELKEIAPDPIKFNNKASLYEYWEWQERQCKYVVNGQRVYDWLALDWRLPLWDTEYLMFWKKVPLHLKYGQRLYRMYLNRENYFGVFDNFKAKVWRWPGASIAILPIAKMIDLLAGNQAKNKFYHYAQYLGHYGYYYSAIGLGRYLKQIKNARGAASFLIDLWIEENSFENNLNKMKYIENH